MPIEIIGNWDEAFFASGGNICDPELFRPVEHGPKCPGCREKSNLLPDCDTPANLSPGPEPFSDLYLAGGRVMGECDCGEENTLLYPDGRCQSCVEHDYENTPYDEKPRGDFQYARNFDEEPHTVICRECGSDQFIVGRRSYYTAIKCVKCKWERCIHSG
jgi:hypothetical protein